MAPRLGPLKISFDERQVFTDEILKLKGNVSLIGRSVVIFDIREGDNKEIRLACANIVEEEEAKTTVGLLHTGTFDRFVESLSNEKKPILYCCSYSVGFEEHVGRVSNLSQWNVWVNYESIKRLYHDSCIQVEINFRAPKAQDVMRTFTNFIDLDQFAYLGYESCDKRKAANLLKITGNAPTQNQNQNDEDDTSNGIRFFPSKSQILLQPFLLYIVYVLASTAC